MDETLCVPTIVLPPSHINASDADRKHKDEMARATERPAAGPGRMSAGRTGGGRRHLARVDPAMARLCRLIGPCRLVVERDREPYQALIRAIAHQQLHGRAAEVILGRFLALYPGVAFPAPEAVLATEEAALRGCGFSGAKIAAIRDIARHAAHGGVPTRRVAARLDDAALIERLTAIRGVGRWTVEMLLIFTLRRPDVLPVDDFGVREGYRVLHGLPEQPKPKALAMLGQAYAPHRSLAALYLWRAADLAKPAKLPVPRQKIPQGA